MHISRLFEIVYILLNKKQSTAKELSEHFEVSIRTIYRDIETLSQAGIPVFTSRGKGGGIALMEGFVLNKSLLSDEEQNNILIGLQSLSAAQFMKQDQTLSKVTNLFQKEQHQWVEVDFSAWGDFEEEKQLFEKLKRAILERRRVHFTYYNAEGLASERSAEPLKLIFKDKAWYFYAYCLKKQDYRIFKISRLSDFALTEHIFEAHTIPEPNKKMEIEEKNCIQLKLLFSEQVGYRVYDEFPKKSIVKQKNGSLLVEIAYLYSDWLTGYLMSYQDKLEVLEPEELRKEIIRKITQTLNRYLKG